MASSLAQESPQLQNRYTNTAHALHRNFSLGMNRDISSWELPDGYLYDAQDVLCDLQGKIRKRGGTTSPSSSNRTAVVENLLSFRSNGLDGTSGIWGSLGVSPCTVALLDKTSGATTFTNSIAGAKSVAARPFQHGNYGVFPFSPSVQATSAGNGCAYVGGGTGANVTITAATVQAGNNRVTNIAPTSMVAAHLGSIIYLGGTGNLYAGRIVEITSTSAIRVDPTPQYTFTANSGNVTSLFGPSFFSGADVGGRYGTSFQNRIVLGATTIATNASAAGGFQIEANRLRWTLLPTENPAQISFAGAFQYDGDAFLFRGAFIGDQTATGTFYNFQDIPNLGGMTGLANLGDGQLIVFGPRKMFVLSGQLTTNTVANNSLAYSVDQVSNNVGIPAARVLGVDNPARSIQYASSGVIFAANDGIYVYNGSKEPVNILAGNNALYYQARLRAGDTIYGSAYNFNTNHYLLSMSGTDGSLMVNLNNGAVQRQTNLGLFDVVPDPLDPTALYAYRWWDTTAGAPTFTKGGLIRYDPIWFPTSANKTDSDGTTGVLFSLQTAAYVDGRIGVNKLPVDLNGTYKMVGSGSPTATLQADTKLDVSDASWVTIDSAVPAQTVTTTKDWETGALLPDGQAVEYKLFANATCDSFELDALDIGTHQGPEGFST